MISKSVPANCHSDVSLERASATACIGTSTAQITCLPLQNAFGKPESKPIIRDLTKRLADYAKRNNDPYAGNKQIQADMNQALGQAK